MFSFKLQETTWTKNSFPVQVRQPLIATQSKSSNEVSTENSSFNLLIGKKSFSEMENLFTALNGGRRSTDEGIWRRSSIFFLLFSIWCLSFRLAQEWHKKIHDSSPRRILQSSPTESLYFQVDINHCTFVMACMQNTRSARGKKRLTKCWLKT